jgi:hypothetical protein
MPSASQLVFGLAPYLQHIVQRGVESWISSFALIITIRQKCESKTKKGGNFQWTNLIK